jgi:ubiquitin-protein ligase
MASRRQRVLAAAVKKIHKIDHENLLFLPGFNDDLATWHVLVIFPHATPGEMDPSPYAGGRLLFRMDAPKEYPANPPKFVALTPNGVFTPNASLCISIGMYHPGEWRRYKPLGLAGFAANGIFNGLVGFKDLRGGVGIQTTDRKTKERFARESWEFNVRRYPGLCEEFVARALDEKDRLHAARLFLRVAGLLEDEPQTVPGGGAGGAGAPEPQMTPEQAINAGIILIGMAASGRRT